MDRMRLPRLPRSIIVRLYAYGGVALAGVIGLAAMSLHFVRETGRSAEMIYHQGMIGVIGAGDLELLLEQHRRIVEAAPVELDRAHIERDRLQAEEIAATIAQRIEGKEAIAARLSPLLPRLVEQARNVLHLAANFAQSKALDAVGEYSKTANLAQIEIRSYRDERLAFADRALEDLAIRGGQLNRWVINTSLLAIVLIGPLTFIVVNGIGRRIRQITETMLRLSTNDTSVTIAATEEGDEISDMARAVAVFKDNAIALNSEREKVEQLNGWFEIALNNMARGLSMFDADHRLLVCNRRFQEMYALADELCRPGTPIERILEKGLAGQRLASPEAEVAAEAQRWFKRYLELVAKGKPHNLTIELRTDLTIQVAFQPLKDGGCVAVHEDVTEKRRADQRIAKLARVDTLTDVANRLGFREALAACFRNMREGEQLALLWLDLDRFKEVNDTHGHPIGDALLKAFAERLGRCIRRGDHIARLGGDEFAILQSGCASQAEAEALARRLVLEAGRPFVIDGHRLEIGASIGIALAPLHGSDPDELLQNADIALYRAKAEGRGRSVVFRSELAESMRERCQLDQALRSALANNELELYYQPIVDLGTGRVTSCEALMRWRHPERGMIPPSIFIPLAEDIGLIGEIGEWSLMRACRDAASWPEHIKVAVNLSAVQFASGSLVDAVKVALRSSGLMPQRLVLEVTETLLLEDDARTIDMLNEIESMEVSIALDDFGTGYASLAYLRSFPFDKIKIDQTFVRDIEHREDCVAIVRAVTSLAHTLGMRTVAEGVETIEHLEKVAGAGCDEVQGYLFSRPVPASDILEVVRVCGGAGRRAA